MRPIRGSRRFIVVLAAAGLMASMAAPVTAQGPAAKDRFTATALQPSGTIVGDFDKAPKSADGRVSAIVTLADASVASYTGGVKGLAATNPKARGQAHLDLKSSATKAYRAYLKGKQDAFTSALSKSVKSAKVTGRLDLVLNAVTVLIHKEDAATVAALPGVDAVYADQLLKPQTDTSPTFIGATSAWQDLGGQESAGEGVIVGVLDTGIWPEHPSFSDPDPSGKAYAAPAPAPDGSRACQFSGGANPGPAFTCNNKLIGAARFMSTYDAVIGLLPGEFTSARDDDGHGTHTSSTSAGNGGVSASIFGVDRGTISGIAPRAYVEMFKVCGDKGCFQSDSSAAVQAAIGDGVDVINFSISGGANPFSDAVELAFLGAYNAGVFVAASAGNAGPGADTTDHRGPWVTTVAASTHDRAFANTVHVTADGGASMDLDGVSLTAGVGPAPLVVAGGDGLCSTPATAGTYAGQIVICERGLPAGRAEKGFNVLQGGAVGMILYNNAANVTDQETDNHYLPASHIQFGQGTSLVAFVGSHTNVMATISAGVKASAQGDVMASFSSRGGPNQSLGVSKPDITAPGVQILAGNSPQHVNVAGGPQGELFQAIAGTSMSSPHIAGSGALIVALHPTWTPGQIKSALMTTAKTAGLVKEDGSTPFDAFDAGSGRVDLTVAGDPGLTFDATGAQYVAAQSALYTANYPSIYHPAMPGVVTVQRTAHSVLGASSTWKLSASGPSDFKVTVPKSITVGAGGNATFSVTMDASAVPLGETRFATITLAQTKGGTRVLHMPVTIVRRQAPVTFTKACAPTDLAAGDVTSCTLTATNPTFSEVSYSISDKVPSKLKLDAASVVGGSVVGKDTVTSTGKIPAAQPPIVSVASDPGGSPAGYLPLSAFGVAPISGTGDETIANFNVPAFSFGGETWTRLGVVSDGYVVVGGGTGPDVQFINQSLPNATRPNNVLAPFWSDLNPAFGGAIRIGTLTDGSDTWIVVDFDAVREYSVARSDSFEVWIGVASDAHPAEDITMTYGTLQGNGDGGFLTVGAENKFGNRGNNVYYNGAGTLPTSTTELRVTSTPGASSSKVVTFDARAGDNPGSWTNCATLESDAFIGTSYSCVSGTIH